MPELLGKTLGIPQEADARLVLKPVATGFSYSRAVRRRCADISYSVSRSETACRGDDKQPDNVSRRTVARNSNSELLQSKLDVRPGLCLAFLFVRRWR